MGRTWTNAKHSGATFQPHPPRTVAAQGEFFTFADAEPMMPLCRNGLTRIQGC
jgi:hypothetical protein